MKTDGSRIAVCTSLLQARAYRGSQGQLIRRVVFFIIFTCLFIASYRFYSIVIPYLGFTWALCLTASIDAIAAWLSLCLIQYQPIADFLIDVQVESLKVSWCNWLELQRTTGVVLAVMAAFSSYLFACDISWQFLLKSIFVLNI